MDTPKQHILPRGATPYDRVEVIDVRDWITEAPDMGDALALDRAVTDAPQSYRYRWFDYLGHGDAA